MAIKSFKDFIKDKQSKYTFYVDMDGVIVDFNARMKELFGKLPKDYKTRAEFVRDMDSGGVSFWSDMNWKSDAKRLLKRLSRYNFYILSAPTLNNDSIKGKMLWLKKNVIIDSDKIILNSNKARHVKNGKFDILIDDYSKNIENWEKSGGTGILHKSTTDTLREIRKMGL